MNGRIDGPRPVSGPASGARRPTPAPAAAASGNFAASLNQALTRHDALKLSRHAQERLAAAGRTLTPDELQRLERAVQTAADKGSRQCLLLLPDLALVVHTPSRTVITAVADQRRQGGLFTDIDSTMIV